MDLDEQIRRIQSFEDQFKGKDSPHWYGHGYWLRKYLGIPQFLPLLVHMDHGANLKDEPSNSTIATKYPFFVIRAARQKWLKDSVGKESTVMGAPFVHCRRLMGIEKSPDAEGTVAFPGHCTHSVRSVFDWESYAESLKRLPAQFHPVKVCVYWKNLIDRSHEVFLDQGFEVVTAGHMSDPKFTTTFYEILRQKKYATSNIMGSYALYAIEMDIPFFLYGETPTFENFGGDPNVPPGVFSVDESAFSSYYREEDFIFDLSKPVTIRPAARRYCLEKLGANDVVDKNVLRKIILISLLRHGPRRLAVKMFRFCFKS